MVGTTVVVLSDATIRIIDVRDSAAILVPPHTVLPVVPGTRYQVLGLYVHRCKYYTMIIMPHDACLQQSQPRWSLAFSRMHMYVLGWVGLGTGIDSAKK